MTENLRKIAARETDLKQWDAIKGKIIEIRDVVPTDLYVDERYQRNLSRKSAELITKIAKSWDWRKFNLPTVVADPDGKLHLIDGQHTAIAAASRHDIPTLPVKIVDADSIADRAETFVGMNRDRVAVTLGQIFYAEVAAGTAEAAGVKAMCDAADVIILRQPPPRNEYGPGETMAIATLRRLYRVHGPALGTQVLNILVESGLAPLSDWAISGVSIILTSKQYKPRLTDEQIWNAMRAMGKSLLARCYARHAETLQRLPNAAADIIWEHAK